MQLIVLILYSDEMPLSLVNLLVSQNNWNSKQFTI